VGHTIIAQESARNDADTEGPASSAPTAVVAAGTGVPGVSKLVVGKLRLSKYAFVPAAGTTITYQDNLAATTTLTVSPKGSAKSLWTDVHADRLGVNALKFVDKKLGKGFYTLTTSTTFSGLPTATESLTMRVVSAPSHKGTRRHSSRH
jgi:hypothetical protein